MFAMRQLTKRIASATDNVQYRHRCDNVYSADVHAGQRLAASGIAVQHCGHSLVDTGGRRRARGMNRFTCFTMMKITNATIRNSITVLMNSP